MRYANFVWPFLLVGCAEMMVASRDYVEPAEGEVAKVRFNVTEGGELRLIPNRSCVDWSAPGSGIVVGNLNYVTAKPKLIDQKIGMAGQAPAGMRSAEVLVQAGQPMTVNYSSSRTDSVYVYTCKGNFTFTPKAGREYQISAVGCSFSSIALSTPFEQLALTKPGECRK